MSIDDDSLLASSIAANCPQCEGTEFASVDLPANMSGNATMSEEMQEYLEMEKTKKCFHAGCVLDYFGADGECNLECNISDCYFDRGDCEGDNVTFPAECEGPACDIDPPSDSSVAPSVYMYEGGVEKHRVFTVPL